MSEFGRRTLYKAVRRFDGRLVCLDPAYLLQTSKVFDNEGDYERAKSLGWTNDPNEAMRRGEADLDQIGDDAVQSVKDDRHLSESAQLEREAAEVASVAHVLEVPEKRRPGRPKKIIQ